MLLEYPRKGIWAVGFATKENKGIIKNNVKEDIINVFVPQLRILRADSY